MESLYKFNEGLLSLRPETYGTIHLSVSSFLIALLKPEQSVGGVSVCGWLTSAFSDCECLL